MVCVVSLWVTGGSVCVLVGPPVVALVSLCVPLCVLLSGRPLLPGWFLSVHFWGPHRVRLVSPPLCGPSWGPSCAPSWCPSVSLCSCVPAALVAPVPLSSWLWNCARYWGISPLLNCLCNMPWLLFGVSCLPPRLCVPVYVVRLIELWCFEML